MKCSEMQKYHETNKFSTLILIFLSIPDQYTELKHKKVYYEKFAFIN